MYRSLQHGVVNLIFFEVVRGAAVAANWQTSNPD
jgi:hypothetical protein